MKMDERLYQESYSAMRESYETIKRSHRKLRWELSQVDKQISALYHELEKTDLSEEIGYQYAIALQNLLRKRRVVKNEYIPFQILRDNFRESFEQAHKRLSGNHAKSEELCRSLNVSVTIDEVVNL